MRLDDAKKIARKESETSLQVFVVWKDWNKFEEYEYGTEEEYVNAYNEKSIVSVASYEDGEEVI
jgi:hypothetical protein